MSDLLVKDYLENIYEGIDPVSRWKERDMDKYAALFSCNILLSMILACVMIFCVTSCEVESMRIRSETERALQMECSGQGKFFNCKRLDNTNSREEGKE